MPDFSRMTPYDPSPFHIERTARETRESRELIEQLVAHSIASAKDAETRERQMLRWTQAGVLLAALAAAASVVAITVTVIVA